MELAKRNLFDAIKEIIVQSRLRVFRIANSALLESYWHIGKLIIEDEQQGKLRADYGKAILKTLSKQLTLEFGKGFDDSNLRNIRSFYLAFPIRDAFRHELSWTHYRLLSRLDSEEKRNFYITESIASNWSSRELQRQINILASDRTFIPVKNENIKPNIADYIKDPYIFDFLGLSVLTKRRRANYNYKTR